MEKAAEGRLGLHIWVFLPVEVRDTMEIVRVKGVGLFCTSPGELFEGLSTFLAEGSPCPSLCP